MQSISIKTFGVYRLPLEILTEILENIPHEQAWTFICDPTIRGRFLCHHKRFIGNLLTYTTHQEERLSVHDVRIVYRHLRNPTHKVLWMYEHLHCFENPQKTIERLLSHPLLDPSAKNNKIIQKACQNGHTNIVKMLIADSRVDPSDGNNCTLLWACRGAHVEVVKVLLMDERVDPFGYPDLNDPCPAFSIACRVGNIEIIKIFLSYPKEKSYVFSYGDGTAVGKAAVREAAAYGNLEVIKLLLSDPRIKNAANHYYNAIIKACENGHVDIVRFLLLHTQIDPTHNKNEALRSACKDGHVEVVKVLLADPRVDPSVCANEPIQNASARGHAEIVKMLLSNPRVDPSALCNAAILWASERGHAEVVKVLLSDPRVDPSARVNGPIRKASEKEHVEVVKLLSQHPRVIETFKIVDIDVYPAKVRPYLRPFRIDKVVALAIDFAHSCDPYSSLKPLSSVDDKVKI
jgi:ankyrin repeat protein